MVGMATIATVECGGFVADGVMHGRHLRHTKNKPRRSGVYVSAAELCSLSPACSIPQSVLHAQRHWIPSSTTIKSDDDSQIADSSLLSFEIP